jgi:hypothetical protein
MTLGGRDIESTYFVTLRHANFPIEAFINMFAVLDQVTPDIENIRGLNLAVLKLMTV